jgi:hypothetical protein
MRASRRRQDRGSRRAAHLALLSLARDPNRLRN